MQQTASLTSLGWRPFFAAQLDRPELAAGRPARIAAVHRGRVELMGEEVPDSVTLAGGAATSGIAVGDWVVVDPDAPRIIAVLDRFGVFKRRAAGTESVTQLIAANVDTLFIVTSANRDFNVARLERYLALAREAGAYPVIVISKADTVDCAAEFVAAAARLAPGVAVEALDARDPDAVEALAPWCADGQTVALLGSSGVGKSTLVNTLSGAGQATYAARADDQRGRHTTTGRSMHRLPSGGWLIDTPGMRELKLVDVGSALDDVFAEVAELSNDCRFSDCTHDNEPGCAVRRAIDDGRIAADRLARYRKLKLEDRHNTMSVAERRSRDKSLGKLYKRVLAGKQQQKKGDGL